MAWRVPSVVVVLAAVAAVGNGEDRLTPPSLSKPVLKLRATPGNALAPASVLLVAELVGGPEHEDFYCPEVEWDFDNGRRSTSLADCEPYTATSTLERRFVVRQAYVAAGHYRVLVTLRRTDRVVAKASASVHVLAAGGDGESPFAAERR